MFIKYYFSAYLLLSSISRLTNFYHVRLEARPWQVWWRTSATWPRSQKTSATKKSDPSWSLRHLKFFVFCVPFKLLCFCFCDKFFWSALLSDFLPRWRSLGLSPPAPSTTTATTTTASSWLGRSHHMCRSSSRKSWQNKSSWCRMPFRQASRRKKPFYPSFPFPLKLLWLCPPPTPIHLRFPLPDINVHPLVVKWEIYNFGYR